MLITLPLIQSLDTCGHGRKYETDCEIDSDQVYKDQLAEINSLKKRTDVLGFDRQSVMDKVKKSVNAYRPADEKVS